MQIEKGQNQIILPEMQGEIKNVILKNEKLDYTLRRLSKEEFLEQNNLENLPLGNPNFYYVESQNPLVLIFDRKADKDDYDILLTYKNKKED